MVLPLSLSLSLHNSSFNYQRFVSLQSKHADSQLQWQAIFTSLNQQVLFLWHLKEIGSWLKHEFLSAPVDLPTCPRMCSSNREYVKQLCATLHSHARVPPNTPSVNWSLGSVGSPDSPSHWSRGGALVLGHSMWCNWCKKKCSSDMRLLLSFIQHSDMLPSHYLVAFTRVPWGWWGGWGTYLVLVNLTPSFNLIDSLFSWPDLSASTGCPYEEPHTALIWRFIC